MPVFDIVCLKMQVAVMIHKFALSGVYLKESEEILDIYEGWNLRKGLVVVA